MKKILSHAGICVLLFSGTTWIALAQTFDAGTPAFKPQAEIRFSPRGGSFVEGSSFEVPVLIDTKGNSINSMEITILFDPSRLVVISPSGGKSILGLWVEPPSYDNSKGLIRFVGAIPGGITSNAGLIATITFRARSPGSTSLRIRSDSQVLLNDGFGTNVETAFGRADYTISTKPPEGVVIYSPTHPSDAWLNNKNPIFSWDNTVDANAFAFALDAMPNTVPENSSTTTDTSRAYENLPDGIWYFHLKARKGSSWGNTSHYAVKIDTSPPASFTPKIDHLAESSSLRGLVSFKTTDSLSGVDRYEVGVIDTESEANSSPVFLEAESPFQVPTETRKARIVVRAFDVAGNSRDESVDVDTSSMVSYLMKNAPIIALTSLIILLLALFGIHYLVKHHVFHYSRKAWSSIRPNEPQSVATVPHNDEKIDLSSIQIPVEDEDHSLPSSPT